MLMIFVKLVPRMFCDSSDLINLDVGEYILAIRPAKPTGWFYYNLPSANPTPEHTVIGLDWGSRPYYCMG